jgi:hypothetical protein
MNGSRKRRSDPRRFDSRERQPVTVFFSTSLGWLNVCGTPSAAIDGSNGDPLVIGPDLNLLGFSCKERWLHDAQKRFENEGRDGNSRDVRIRDGGGEKRFLFLR